MGANTSKLARTGASAAKKAPSPAPAAVPAQTATPAPSAVQSPFPAGVKLPPGWNPNAPRGQRRPKVAWETDMSQRPKDETIEFIEREDIKNQILAKDFAARGLHLQEKPAAKDLPLTPQDLNRHSSHTSAAAMTTTIPILARRRAQEQIQQQATSSHPSAPVPGLLTLDQLMAVWAAPSEQALAELAAKYQIPLVKLQALRKYTNTYHVTEWGGSYVGVWGAASGREGQGQSQAGVAGTR